MDYNLIWDRFSKDIKNGAYILSLLKIQRHFNILKKRP